MFKEADMTFAKWVFKLSGIYGILILGLFYFMETNPLFNAPPAITHPEYYYGFVGVGMAFQVVFLLIASDPLKYRAMMIPSMIEKFSFVGALLVLLLSHRVSAQLIPAGILDGTMGILFVVSYFKTKSD